MSPEKLSCPLSQEEVIESYFLEHRAKLLDIAAFLDRINRAQPPVAGEDYRIAALKKAAAVLGEDQGDRVKRMLEIFSDPTQGVIDQAGVKGAAGAWAGGQG